MATPARKRTVRQRLISIILFTSVAVLVLTCTSFFGYELVTFRRTMTRDLSTLAQIIATNCTAALAFQNSADAEEVLAALQADPSIVAAGLYAADGQLFVRYPARSTAELPPAATGFEGQARYERGGVVIYQPVRQGGRTVGTLFLKVTLEKVYQRLRIYVVVITLVAGCAVGAAYVIGRILQRSVSEPILALAEVANAVWQRQDYSVRAATDSFGEIAQLTEAFNHMLTRIQEQTQQLSVSAARHRMLFENSPLPMWVFDLETLRFLAVNAAAASAYGYTHEQFLAMTITDVRLPDEPPRPPGLAPGRRIVRHRHRDGTIVLVEVTSHDLSFDGRSARLALVNDVTARLNAEAEIRRLNAQLEQRIRERTAELETANKELESFSYSVSHDLRAPLRHVQGYVAMLTRATEGQLSEQAQRYLKIINDAGVEMGQLIDDLLEFSRMGRIEMSAGRVALDEVVRDSVRRLESAAAGRAIEWKIAPLPAVSGDVAMLRQVFANLLGNAIKYTRRRHPAVIEIGHRDGTDGATTVFVRDNGAGFDMKYAGKLFGVFQRLHRADEFEGTGIGLATVRRIIARHGGRVWAEGAIEAGATFYFTLRKSG